jgi:3-hydroxyacyl-CoA dehydrogenase
MADVKRAAVIGTGTMGPGMGAVLARAGIDVALYDVSAEALERAKAGFELADGVLDRLETPRVEGGGIRYESDLAAALAGAEFVAEAIPERLELKQELFPQLEQLAAPSAILSSNTSGIPITKIAEVCSDPTRVVGLHWSNPPHLIPMIEVIPGDKTSQETVDASVALVNRIMREAVDLVDRGIIDADGMDRCVRWGIGYKLAVIGPMELLDMAGLDIYTNVGSYLNKDLCNGSEVSKTITDRVERNELGIKSGKGLYDYTPERIAELRAERARKLVAVRKALES